MRPLDLRRRAIAHRRQVGNQADVPEHDRHRRVGRDREHVPDERALELRPQAHRVRIREQPVGRQPRTAGVEHREDRRAGHREDRHRFGEAADRHAPLLLEQQQDRRDQRAGVADADPPDEVDDRERPADRAGWCRRCRCRSSPGSRAPCAACPTGPARRSGSRDPAERRTASTSGICATVSVTVSKS